MERHFYTTSNLQLSVGGLLLRQNYASGTVTSASDWTSLSAVYQSYRIKQMRFHFIPIQTSSNAATTYMPSLVIGRFWGAIASQATTVVQILNEPGSIIESSLEKITMETNFRGYPDAQLWTATGTAVPAVNQFGFVVMGSNTVGVASSLLADLYIEYIVDFVNPW